MPAGLTLWAIFTAALVLGGACTNLPPGTAARTFRFAGTERTYVVHPGPSATKRALVLVLHGGGGRGATIEHRTHFDAVADLAGAVAVYPDALGGEWNAGWGKGSTDDVGFLAALADFLVAEYRIDSARVYVAGLSNGASMAHRFACERDTVAAVAAVAGDMPGWLRGRCASGRAISVIEIHGKDDSIVPYDDELTATVAMWVARDGCSPPQSRTLPDVDPTDGTRVRLDAYGSCRDGTEVALYTIEGGGHAWPGGEPLWSLRAGRTSHDMDASAALWEFFATKTRTRP